MKIISNISSLSSRLMSAMHTLLLKADGNISIGVGTTVYWRSHVNVRLGGKVTIGEYSAIGRSAEGYHCGMPFHTCILVDGGDKAQVSIGSRCRINGAYIHARSSVSIGDRCLMASGVNILDSNGHVLCSLDRTCGSDSPEPIVIGNNVWIGMNSTILKGSVIPDNCVVATGAVVKGVFPENSLISGNPAVAIKKLNSPDK